MSTTITSNNDNRMDRPDSPHQLVLSFLSAQSDTFRSLAELRAQGWENPRGDRHFQHQRKAADEAGYKSRRIFFKLMQQIGDEMQSATEAFRILTPSPRVLDLCMAPGGYTATALKYNPTAEVRGVSLPRKLGGHEIIIKDPRVKVWLTDITMLAAQFGVTEVPHEHPDRENFILDKEPYENMSFDLVLCDGQVLRTHARSSYRERNEATRLSCSQLVLALQRIKSGGTLIMLLHRVEAVATITLLSTFDKFAVIRLFKPLRTHASRSSFYLVASNVRPKDSEALKAVAKWKTAWMAATFPEQELADGLSSPVTATHCSRAEEISNVLAEFGPKLIELGDPIWKIQKEALEKAPWFRKGRTVNIPGSIDAGSVQAET